MVNNLSVEFEIPLVSFVFMALLTFVYFHKEKADLIENRFYSVILIASIFEIFIDFVAHSICAINPFATITTGFYVSLFTWMNRFMLLGFSIVLSSLFAYTLIITFPKLKNKFNVINICLIIFNTLIFIITCFLSVEIYEVGSVTNVKGPLIDFGLLVMLILLVMSMFIALLNIKHLDKRYLPIFLILALLVFFYFVLIYFPELIIYDFILAILCYLMYFTIENPDVKMLEQVSLARDKAEKANKAKTDFLSNMSHEIRTPLNAIVGFSECILTDETLESAKKDAQDIVIASQNLLEIVNGILDISKIEADKVEFVNIEYNLKNELNELIKLIQPRIGEKPIQLKVNFAEDLPYNLYGDIGKIRQIVSNILTNAIKYTEQGYIAIEVSCINRNNESTIVISVEDTGRGIKPDKIDKIFDKFERLEEDRNTTLEGTGLGLAITKRLAEMMGGKVIVQSKYGEGSKFTVYLKQEIHTNTEKKMKRVIEPVKILDVSDKKVLVVDDNRINLKVAVRLLEQYHVDVTECESGTDCLLKVKEDNYDLILMDDMMPKISGTETLQELKKLDHFNTPVVVLTANALEGMKEKYLEAGFVDYLSKPIDKKELERVLSKTLVDIDVTREVSFEPLPSEIYDLDTPLKEKEDK